jgi:hypothetical protein
LGFNGVLGGALPHYGSFEEAEGPAELSRDNAKELRLAALAAASRIPVIGR